MTRSLRRAIPFFKKNSVELPEGYRRPGNRQRIIRERTRPGRLMPFRRRNEWIPPGVDWCQINGQPLRQDVYFGEIEGRKFIPSRASDGCGPNLYNFGDGGGCGGDGGGGCSGDGGGGCSGDGGCGDSGCGSDGCSGDTGCGMGCDSGCAGSSGDTGCGMGCAGAGGGQGDTGCGMGCDAGCSSGCTGDTGCGMGTGCAGDSGCGPGDTGCGMGDTGCGMGCDSGCSGGQGDTGCGMGTGCSGGPGGDTGCMAGTEGVGYGQAGVGTGGFGTGSFGGGLGGGPGGLGGLGTSGTGTEGGWGSGLGGGLGGPGFGGFGTAGFGTGLGAWGGWGDLGDPNAGPETAGPETFSMGPEDMGPEEETLSLELAAKDVEKSLDKSLVALAVPGRGPATPGRGPATTTTMGRGLTASEQEAQARGLEAIQGLPAAMQAQFGMYATGQPGVEGLGAEFGGQFGVSGLSAGSFATGAPGDPGGAFGQESSAGGGGLSGIGIAGASWGGLGGIGDTGGGGLDVGGGRGGISTGDLGGGRGDTDTDTGGGRGDTGGDRGGGGGKGGGTTSAGIGIGSDAVAGGTAGETSDEGAAAGEAASESQAAANEAVSQATSNVGGHGEDESVSPGVGETSMSGDRGSPNEAIDAAVSAGSGKGGIGSDEVAGGDVSSPSDMTATGGVENTGGSLGMTSTPSAAMGWAGGGFGAYGTEDLGVGTQGLSGPDLSTMSASALDALDVGNQGRGSAPGGWEGDAASFGGNAAQSSLDAAFGANFGGTQSLDAAALDAADVGNQGRGGAPLGNIAAAFDALSNPSQTVSNAFEDLGAYGVPGMSPTGGVYGVGQGMDTGMFGASQDFGALAGTPTAGWGPGAPGGGWTGATSPTGWGGVNTAAVGGVLGAGLGGVLGGAFTGWSGPGMVGGGLYGATVGGTLGYDIGASLATPGVPGGPQSGFGMYGDVTPGAFETAQAVDIVSAAEYAAMGGKDSAKDTATQEALSGAKDAISGAQDAVDAEKGGEKGVPSETPSEAPSEAPAEAPSEKGGDKGTPSEKGGDKGAPSEKGGDKGAVGDEGGKDSADDTKAGEAANGAEPAPSPTPYGALSPPGDMPTEAPKGGLGDVGGKGGTVNQNQKGVRTGALAPGLVNILSTAAKSNDVNINVVSGGQPSKGPGRIGSHRHDDGRAADLQLTDAKDGHTLSMNNPKDKARMQQFLADAVKNGATGIGAATNYMGDKTMHVGGGPTAAWGAKGSTHATPGWVSQALKDGLSGRGLPGAKGAKGAKGKGGKGQVSRSLDQDARSQGLAGLASAMNQARAGQTQANMTTGKGAAKAEQLTFYAPGAKGKMEGGWTTSRGNPNLGGKTVPTTLDDVAASRAQGKDIPVTLAGHPSNYGKTVDIGTVNYTGRDGKQHTLTGVKGFVHDTGGAFKGESAKGHFDIATFDARGQTDKGVRGALNKSQVTSRGMPAVAPAALEPPKGNAPVGGAKEGEGPGAGEKGADKGTGKGASLSDTIGNALSAIFGISSAHAEEAPGKGPGKGATDRDKAKSIVQEHSKGLNAKSGQAEFNAAYGKAGAALARAGVPANIAKSTLYNESVKGAAANGYAIGGMYDMLGHVTAAINGAVNNAMQSYHAAAKSMAAEKAAAEKTAKAAPAPTETPAPPAAALETPTETPTETPAPELTPNQVVAQDFEALNSFLSGRSDLVAPGTAVPGEPTESPAPSVTDAPAAPAASPGTTMGGLANLGGPSAWPFGALSEMRPPERRLELPPAAKKEVVKKEATDSATKALSGAFGADIQKWAEAQLAFMQQQLKENGGKSPSSLVLLPRKDGGAVMRYPRAAHGIRKFPSGLVHSAVPGRTDKHEMTVATGSYVLPAHHVSGMDGAEGNTLAGAEIIKKMFAPGTKFGSRLKIPKMANGGRTRGFLADSPESTNIEDRRDEPPLNPGSPNQVVAQGFEDLDSFLSRRPNLVAPRSALNERGEVRIPRRAKQFKQGGMREEGSDIIVAGGEVIIPPDVVRRVGGGDLTKGHDILDAWVKKTTKKLAKTIRKLPGPKK